MAAIGFDSLRCIEVTVTGTGDKTIPGGVLIGIASLDDYVVIPIKSSSDATGAPYAIPKDENEITVKSLGGATTVTFGVFPRGMIDAPAA